MKSLITPYVIAKETEMVIDTLAPKLFAKLHILIYPIFEKSGLEVSIEARDHSGDLFGTKLFLRYEDLDMKMQEFSERFVFPSVHALIAVTESNNGRS